MVLGTLTLSICAQSKTPVKKPIPKTAQKIDASIAEIEATTRDGKSVLLRSDGTWVYTTQIVTSDRSNEEAVPRKLPVGFLADDIKAVIAFLSADKQKLWKSEYETEQEYRDRLSKINYETNTVKKPLTDIVFIFPMKQSYDAENGAFAYEPYNSLNFLAPFQLVRRSNNELQTIEPSFSFAMPRQDARRVGYNLRVATFGYPVKIDDSYPYKDEPRLFFLLKNIIVFNKETGDIHYQQDF
jgi:hypothetical protein